MDEGMRDYTTARDDLDQALEELAEAGYRVVCGPVVQEVFTSPDPAPAEFVVRDHGRLAAMGRERDLRGRGLRGGADRVRPGLSPGRNLCPNLTRTGRGVR